MIVIKIVLGLLGLGIVVFIHELGHFLGARLCGINVDAFSIGWGRPFLKKKIGSVEYRLGIFPLGGYCKMQGDSDYQAVYDNFQNGKTPPKGSFYSASPFRRILVSFFGPFFNLIFAILALSIIWGAGFQMQALDNRIVLASELNADEQFPADKAGLQTGDRIIEINNRKISWFHEIQEIVSTNPEKQLTFNIERGNEKFQVLLAPLLDKSTGSGRIGIISWVDPVLENVSVNSPGYTAGLESGDRILYANNIEIRNSLDLNLILISKPNELSIEFMRNNEIKNTVLIPEYPLDSDVFLGIQWALMEFKSPALPVPLALKKGVKESWNTLVLSLRSFRLLFRGIDLTKAVSGPVRITYMGDIAAESFSRGISTGLRSMANFLALISIALCIMNLLPLPILDGGMIVLFIIEFIRGKPLSPRIISIFQTFGVIIICCLMAFAIFGDVLYLAGK